MQAPTRLKHRNRHMSTLILFSHSFPYGFVEPFLETEIVHLASQFETIILVPCRVYGDPRPVPENVRVVTSLGEHWPKGAMRGIDSVLACIRSALFYKECISKFKSLLHWNAFARLVAFIGDYNRLRKWGNKFLPQLISPDEPTIIYTYWTGPLTLAASSFKQDYPHLKVVSRAHRIDLYEEIHTRDYLPLRAKTLTTTDYVFAVSAHGQQYIKKRYPKVKVEVARLGVNDPGFTIQFSRDEIFRIVSCSYMKPVKRLDLLLAAVESLAQKNSAMRIEWHHLGSGDLYNQLEELAQQRLRGNARHIFHGQLPNSQVMDFYQTHPIDVFVNVSASEGVPVSIMEAQSCGIPVIATAVGGTPEIINDDNGILLECDPSVVKVTDALQLIAESYEIKLKKSISSKQTWRLMYNAKVNYIAFAERLWTLFGT